MTDEGRTSLLCKAHADAQKSNKTATGPHAQAVWEWLCPVGKPAPEAEAEKCQEARLAACLAGMMWAGVLF